MDEQVIEVEGRNWVFAVSVSPDSTRFATGTGGFDNKVSVWSITNKERLVGPLKHDGSIYGITFSPSGEHIATASNRGLIRIFDSRNCDELITIETLTPSFSYHTYPLHGPTMVNKFSPHPRTKKSGVSTHLRGLRLLNHRLFMAAQSHLLLWRPTENSSLRMHRVPSRSSTRRLSPTFSLSLRIAKTYPQLPSPQIVGILRLDELTGKSSFVTSAVFSRACMPPPM
ncbi:WD40-repeat-containing domain protein [Lanmaoa asiatica]|nr:WD40-repeat-containing domain protein [Lanmaoa asiatica]